VLLVKSELVNLRKKIFNYIKSKAYGYEGKVSPELKKYQKDQRLFAKRKFEKSNFNQLKNSVSKADIIYLGDFHTFDQNIRNVLRILKVLISEKSQCIVALEMVEAQFQLYIDAYLGGHITDLEFLESINYHDSWRFPWTHYKLIFELAKEHSIKIIGINTGGNLLQRDEFAADVCDHALKSHPGHKLLVVYGELHISPNKIPEMVKAKLPTIAQVIIHQNLDEVYWKLIEDDMKADIIRFSEKEYCINSAPPWVKYESMVYWYENLCDDPEFDIHEYIIENGKKIFSEDIDDNFLQMCNEMIKVLKLDISLAELEDFNLKDHSSLEYIEEKILSLKDSTLINYYQHLIETSQSFKVPDSPIYYCSSYSMNRMAYLAGIHILHFYLSKRSISNKEIFLNRGAERFVLLTYEAIFAYFFSKVINPHRKCEMYQDIQRRKRLKNIKTSQKNIYEACIEILNGKELKYILRGKRLTQLHSISLYVGHILGEYLYLKVFEKGQLPVLTDNLIHQEISLESFKHVRKELLKDYDYKNGVKRYF
jgi:uncharacterized iron-regulated protein